MVNLMMFPAHVRGEIILCSRITIYDVPFYGCQG